MSLDDAIAALEAGREEDALVALLRVWKAAPGPALSAAIEALGTKLDAGRTRPTGKTVKDKEAKWHAVVDQGQAADVGNLLATLAEVAKAAPLEARLEKLAARPPDPRVAMKLATMVEAWPIPGSTGIESLKRALEIIVEIGDSRARPVLERIQGQLDGGHMTTWFLTQHLEHYIAQMRAYARQIDPPAKLDRVMALVIAEFQPATATSADAGALYAAVYANPDDDGVRAVLSDFLQERGDPRGEFIALQLAPANSPGAKARRAREAELLRSHGREWLGPLEPAILKSGLKYERGFVAKCAIKRPGNAVDDRLLEAREWATITEIGVSGWQEVGRRAATLMPALRALTGVQSFMPSHPRIEHVEFESFHGGAISHFADVEAPAVRSLVIEDSFFAITTFQDFWSTPLGRQLEYFTIDCGSLDDWIPDLHARLAPRGKLQRAVVSMHRHFPWRFWLEADGAIRCLYAWTFSEPERHFEELADRLERFPPAMFTKVRLDFTAKPSPRLAAAIARFS